MDATSLVTLWRAKAKEQMRLAKAVRCHSMDQTKQGYLKRATAYLECADDLEREFQALQDSTLEGPEAEAATG